MWEGKMNRSFIAYGAGVGSTAILYQNLKQIKKGDIEVIYSNHECDLPESRDYVSFISNTLDIDITQLSPGNLYNYCWQRRILPSIHWRWCTDKFKIRPMRKYVDGDIPLIGITNDERKRARDFQFGGKSEFPLLDKRITRIQALQMIEAEKPCKSGCFFCPFQGKPQWRSLFESHKDLFLKAEALEDHARERNPKIYLYNKLLKNLKIEFETQTKLGDKT
jgi:hypothetical protein